MKYFAFFVGILLSTLILFSPCPPAYFDANLMPEETLDDDTEETDNSVVRSEIQRDLDIFISSPRGSALLAASEGDMDSILGLESPKGDKSLNEIRFDGWTEDDFFDNDYLRAFRRYMDAWLQGKKMDETEADHSVLEPYRDRLGSGKFFVFDVRGFMFGGLLYALISIDDPSLMLSVWIYSTIDDSHINAYQVQYVGVSMDLEKMLREEGIPKDTLRQWLYMDNIVCL